MFQTLTHWSVYPRLTYVPTVCSIVTVYHLSLVTNGVNIIIKSFNNFLCELFFGFLVVMNAVTQGRMQI